MHNHILPAKTEVFCIINKYFFISIHRDKQLHANKLERRQVLCLRHVI